MCALHVYICHLTVFVKCWGIKQRFLPAPPFTWTRPDDTSFLLHVCASENKNQRGGGTLVGVLENKRIHTSVLGSHLFWVHVNMDASVVLWTKGCHCYHPPHFAAVQGSWFYMAYALFLCNEAVQASRQI